jgi:hypothetical protein
LTIYDKNLSALKKNRPQLCKKLKKIKTNEKFEVYISNNEINILDIDRNTLFYDKPKESIKKRNDDYKKYREYPFLYLFGIDNGQVIKKLLQNKKMIQLVLIEPELELIYIVLNLIDFSEDLKQNRLLILMSDEVNYSLLINLIHVSNAKYYVRNFDLILNSDYTGTFYIDIYKEIFSLWLKVLDYIVQANGNDINDTFRGIKQHLQNVDLMLDNPQYQKLLNKKSIETAVVVSTGPSLDKQLSTLKEYQDKICILCVDASFPILIRYGIKPDFVFSMERDEPTAIFFTELPKKSQKGIIFLCASLQHRVVLDAIKSKVIVMRPFAYNSYFDMHDYGYLCKGMSSANMAHEFATAFGFKQITFIGQDLAFGKDLKTHSDEHVIKEKNELLESEIKSDKLIEVDAYGDSGKVKSNKYWVMFKNFIEHHIEENHNKIKTYNSTEGGAKIEGTIEKPFKKFLKQYALENKSKITIRKPNKTIIEKQKLDYKNKLNTLRKELLELKESVDKSFIKVADECKKVENKEKKDALKVFSIGKTMELLDEISRIRKHIESSEVYTTFLVSIIQPLMYSMELEIAQIKVRYVDNPEDNQLKALQWILAHRFWLFSFSGVIENVIQVIEESE